MRRKIPDLSITSSLLQRYRSGDLRPVDTIRKVIERIESLGETRGAVFTSTVSNDSLIEWAQEVEDKMDPVTSPLYGVPYVFFNPHSYSHLFNKIDIHTTYTHKFSSSLYLAFHILLHTLTQAIMRTYINLKPQVRGQGQYRCRRIRHDERVAS